MDLFFGREIQGDFRDKIEYVNDIFLNSYLDIYSSDRERVKILYSREPGEDWDILIYSNDKTIEYFSSKSEFPIERIKYFEYEGEKLPFLFYDENAKEIFQKNEKNGKIEIFADIFASAFFFLSHWEEFISWRKDRHNRFIAEYSIQAKLNILTFPIVNRYFDILRDILVKYYNFKMEKTGRYNGKPFALGISHDIDHIQKWSLGIIYREIFKLFLFNYKRLTFSERIHRLKLFFRSFLGRNDPYRISIKKIIDFENSKNIKSTFFFKSGGNSIHDSKYSIKNNYLRKIIENLNEKDFDIGLHPSYNAYNNYDLMRSEKLLFESQHKITFTGVRQHFLRYDIRKTPQIQNELEFIYDSTLGFCDYEGFRSSFALPYQIFDVVNNKKLDIWEIPLVVMDATLTDYRKLNNDDSLEVFKKMIRILMRFKGFGVFLFHNSIYDDFDNIGWGEVFEETINYALKENAYVGNLNDILNIIKK